MSFSVLPRLLDRLHADAKDFFLPFLQFMIAMDLGVAQKDMNARLGRMLHRFSGAVDILGRAPRQAADGALRQSPPQWR